MENGGIFTNNDEFGWLKRVRLVIYKGATLNNLTFKPMILSGTEEKPYEPYTGGKASPNPDYPQEIESIKDSITFKRIGKNIISINEKVGSGKQQLIINTDDTSKALQPFKLKKGDKVTVSYKMSNIQILNNSFLCTRKGDMSYNYPFNGTTGTITIENDIDYIGLVVHLTKVVDSNFKIYDIQIEKGTEATEYEPYNEDVYTLPIQQEMLKINNYEDLFIKKDDENWYERHVLKKYIIDGENNVFSNMVVGTAFTTFDFNVVRNIFTKQEYWITCDNALSNMFSQGRLGGLVGKDNIKYLYTFCTWGYYAKFSFENNKFASVDEANQYLSELNANNKPLILYVALKTPEEILCTPEQTAVLNQLEQFPLQKGINHIYSDDELSPKFKLMYYQDINILLDKINKNIADVSAQLIEGGSNV